MSVHYTLLNVIHQPLRTMIAVLGVAFAALMVFVQLGFLCAAGSAAIAVLGELDYDLILLGPDYINIARAGTFSRTHLYQVRADKDVAQVTPLYVTLSPWRIHEPTDPALDGRHRNMLIVGFDVADRPFLLDEVTGGQQALTERGAVLIDRCSPRKYFGDLSTGTAETELGAGRAHIVGEFALKTGFSADGLALVSDETFAEINGGAPADSISLGLVKLRPGANRNEVAARLRAALPAGGVHAPVRILTRDQAEWREIGFWIWQTALGLIFLAGTVVAVLIGVVFVYQVISSDMQNRLREFATLKAIGYSDAYLSRNVLAQALVYGLCGLPLAVAAARLLFWGIEWWLILSMPMPPDLVLIVCFVTLLMCAASGLLAVRRIKTVDPAELF